MNLQENIERVRSIMGVISEDRKEMFTKNMIDDIGLENTIKMVGDYDEVEPYLSDEDKVKYVKNKVLDYADKIGSNGIWLREPQGRPLRINDEGGIIHNIEFLGQSHAGVEVYEKGKSNRPYRIMYKDSPPQIIDMIIKRLIEM